VRKYIIAILLSCPCHLLFAANDGLDIDANQNLLIEDCYVSGGDDALCMKSCVLKDGSKPPVTKNNVTRNTVVYTIGYRAPQIGAESASDLQDVYYQDMHIVNCGASCLSIGYNASTGGHYSNIHFENFFGENNGDLIISSNYREPGSSIDGVTIKNMYLNAGTINLSGSAQGGVSNVSLNNIWLRGALQTDLSKIKQGPNVTNVTMNTTPVAVRITRPTADAVLDTSSPIVLEATAFCPGSGSVDKVEFYNGTEKIGESTSSPSTCIWTTTSEGTGTLTAIASFSSGTETSLAIPVELRGAPHLNSVTISPGANSSGPGTSIPYRAIAYDQFGNTLQPQPALSWSVSGGGTVDANGVLLVGGSTGTFTVQARATVNGISKTGSTTLEVTDTFKTYALQDNSDSTYTWGSLNNGNPAYCDNTAPLKNIPAKYQGLQLLQTSWNDYKNPFLFASFKVSHPARVFVAMPDKATNPAPWFSAYANTGDKMTVGSDSYGVYYKDYPANSVILLGPKSGTANTPGRTYFAFVQPQPVPQ